MGPMQIIRQYSRAPEGEQRAFMHGLLTTEEGFVLFCQWFMEAVGYREGLSTLLSSYLWEKPINDLLDFVDRLDRITKGGEEYGPARNLGNLALGQIYLQIRKQEPVDWEILARLFELLAKDPQGIIVDPGTGDAVMQWIILAAEKILQKKNARGLVALVGTRALRLCPSAFSRVRVWVETGWIALDATPARLSREDLEYIVQANDSDSIADKARKLLDRLPVN